VKLEFPEHDVLEVQEIQHDLESYILKAHCDKVMPSQLMKIGKNVERIHFGDLQGKVHIIHKLITKKKSWVSG